MPASENKDVATEECHMVRFKVFNFHSIRSVLISKLETKIQKTDMCEYKLDKGSDGNLIHISIKHFFHIQILVKQINKKYNYSCIPQMSIAKLQ